jgi:hypothetical protein
MKFKCLLHTGCEFEEIPFTAIQIGHGKRGASRMFRFQDGTHHLLGVTKRNNHHVHLRWHKNRPKEDCEHCSQESEPEVLKQMMDEVIREVLPDTPDFVATPTVESQSSFALALEEFKQEHYGN